MVAGNKSCVLLESCFGVQMFGPGEVVVCYVLPWQVVNAAVPFDNVDAKHRIGAGPWVAVLFLTDSE